MKEESVLRKLLNAEKEKNPALPDTAEMTPAERFNALPKAVSLEADVTLLEDHTYLGDIFGKYNKETYEYVQQGTSLSNHAKLPKLGVVVTPEEYHTLMEDPTITREDCAIFGAFIDQKWKFNLFDESRRKMDLIPYQIKKELSSRSVGLLDTDAMLQKTAIIVGGGSVGSFVALLLSKLGVGRFILVDRDTLKVDNICRHARGWESVTDYKVDALRDLIYNNNPYAKVEVFHGWLDEMPYELVADVKDGIVISTADHHGSNAAANELAELLGLPYVNIGCWENAYAGGVFHWLPNTGQTLYGDALAGVLERERQTKPRTYDYYLNPDANTSQRQMGLVVNILYITCAGMFKILDLLNLNTENYVSMVLHALTAYTVPVVTNRSELGGELADIVPSPLCTLNFELAADVNADA